MTRIRLQQSGDLYLQGGYWKLRWYREAIDANGLVERYCNKPAMIGPATGPGGVTNEQAQRIAWENFLVREQQQPQLQMTCR